MDLILKSKNGQSAFEKGKYVKKNNSRGIWKKIL